MENSNSISSYKANRKRFLIITLFSSILVVVFSFVIFWLNAKLEIKRELSENTILRQKLVALTDRDDATKIFERIDFENKTYIIKVWLANTYDTISFDAPFFIFEKKKLHNPDTFFIKRELLDSDTLLYDTLSLNDILTFSYDSVVNFLRSHYKGTLITEYTTSEDESNHVTSGNYSNHNSNVRENPKVYQGSEQQRRDLEAIDAYGAEHPEFW